MAARVFLVRSLVAVVVVGSMSVACGDDPAPASGFRVGGTVADLVGAGLVLQNDAGDDLAITSNGSGADRFDFPKALATGSPYAVTVKAQPAGQVCSVGGGTGTIASAAVTNVVVKCATLHTVGVHVTGLVGGSVVLQNNGKDDLSVAVNGTQTFATTVPSGTAYAVTILSQTSGGGCTVAGGAGTVGIADIVVEVNCLGGVFVDAVNGLDTNFGNASSPFKTITHAIAAAPVDGATISLKPGIYSEASGETFPLVPKSNQIIVGDVANKGIGTSIRGGGGHLPTAGDLVTLPLPFTYAVVFASGVTGAAVNGVSFDSTVNYAFIADGATASLDSCTIPPTGASGVVANGAHLTITNSVLSGRSSHFVFDATTKLKLRGSSVVSSENSTGALVIGAITAVPGGQIDLGTPEDPGNNTFGLHATGVALVMNAVVGPLSAIGNTWTPNKQGADATGHYASTLVVGPVPSLDGNNYELPAGSSLQL